MRKYGKYQRMPDGTRAKQPTAKSLLLQTYFTSLICVVLCVSMFFGTSYAWFTSEASNEGNEIYIGTLDVGLFKQDGADWVDLSEDGKTLFDGDIRWEPGYTALETIKIRNEGDLAFRYALTFTNGTVNGAEDEALLKKLAENFVVYVHVGDYAEDEKKPNSIDDIQKIANDEDTLEKDKAWRQVRMGKDPATLADILEKGFPVLSGNMEDVRADAADPTATLPGPNDSKPTEDTYIIALHMLETAGQGKDDEESIKLSEELMGNKICLNVKLTAYQRTHEEDAFDASYDLKAHVTDLGALDIEYSEWIGKPTQTMTLDTAYQFQPVESYEEALQSPYKKYIADFVVWADDDVDANTVALAGYYDAWCSLNQDRWIVLQADQDITAGTEIRLVQTMGSEFAVTYEMLCQYGNDGIGFMCGAKDLTGDNAGTTITVELRIFEVIGGVETGNYTIAGRYEYTFPNRSTTP